MLRMKGKTGVKKSFLFLMFLAVSLFALPGFALAYTTAVLDTPTLGGPPAGGFQIHSDLYLYECDDSSCTAPTQSKEYGHITNVEKWPTAIGGCTKPGDIPPAAWVFLTLNDNQSSYFKLWEKSEDATKGTQWRSCVMAITADGQVGTENTCVGLVAVAYNGSGEKPDNFVPHFSLGIPAFSKSDYSTTGPTSAPSEENELSARSVKVVNNTGAAEICLATDGSAATHGECDGAQSPVKHYPYTKGPNKISQGSSYILDASKLKDGYNSGTGFVTDYKLDSNPSWVPTGWTSEHVYANPVEWTIYPEHAVHTPGPTTADISLVDGYNVGITLSVENDTVCAVAYEPNGPSDFLLFKAGDIIAQFPNNLSVPRKDLCPSNEYAPGGHGCFSPCAMAYVNGSDQDTIDKFCCAGKYDTTATCTAPAKSDYHEKIIENSKRVYTFAFDDWRGTFTCQHSAQLVYTLTNPHAFD
jgi:hypothetical protein